MKFTVWYSGAILSFCQRFLTYRMWSKNGGPKTPRVSKFSSGKTGRVPWKQEPASRNKTVLSWKGYLSNKMAFLDFRLVGGSWGSIVWLHLVTIGMFGILFWITGRSLFLFRQTVCLTAEMTKNPAIKSPVERVVFNADHYLEALFG